MKKYITLNSKEVQEALFKADFSWGFEGKAVMFVDKSFLFIYEDGYLTYTDSFEYVAEKLKTKDYIVINSAAIIKDPYQLERSKQPEKIIKINNKKWPESTITKALKAYIKDGKKTVSIEKVLQILDNYKDTVLNDFILKQITKKL